MRTKVRWRDLDDEYKARLKKAGLLNGCGPKLRWLNWLVPDVIFGLHVEEDCDQHDFNYLLGCSEPDRVKGDYQFWEAMDKRAVAQTWRWSPRRWILRRAARVYHWGVRRWGAKFGGFYYGPQERSREEIDRMLTEAEAKQNV